MTARTAIHNLQVANPLLSFINDQMLPATGVDKDKFWKGFNDIVADLAPKNIALLAERDRIQTAMDAWHTAHPGPVAEGKAMKDYRKFLSQIGYLVPEPRNAQATTANVDAELAKLAGPQLVVPILIKKRDFEDPVIIGSKPSPNNFRTIDKLKSTFKLFGLQSGLGFFNQNNYTGEDVNGRDVLLYSSLIRSGNTMRKQVRELKNLGAKSIYFFGFHGLCMHH